MRFIENPDLREWVKDSLCRVVFQKAHELAVQTGCEILIKFENTTDQSGQFYATSALNQQYQDQGLSKQPWEVRVCGATGLPEAMLVETGCQSDEMSAYDIQCTNRRAIVSNHSRIDDVGQFHTEGLVSSLDERLTGTLCAMVDNPIAAAMLPLQNDRSAIITHSMEDDRQVLAEVPNSWLSEAIHVENESSTDNRLVAVEVEKIKQETVEQVAGDFNACSFGPFVMPDLPVSKTYTPDEAIPWVMQHTTDIVPTGISINATYPVGISSNPEAFTQECSPTLDIDQNVASTSQTTVSAVPDSANLVKPYQCGACCKRFSAITKLSAHALQEHGMAMRTSSSLQCNICGLGFKMAMNLQRHMEKHKVSMPHACKVCQKEFFDLDSLLKHELIHSRMYRCGFCHKVFPRQTTLNAHISRKHGGTVTTHMARPNPIQKITTDEPSLPVASPCQALLEHVKFRSSTTTKSRVIPANQAPLDTRQLSKQSSRNHVCNLCGKSYTSGQSLREHLASHSGIRPYKCKICFATYFRLRQLKDHLIHHSKLYPHRCQICGRGFIRPGLMRKHLKTCTIGTNGLSEAYHLA